MEPTPVSVTDPPSPSENLTPNDVWTVRIAVGGLVAMGLVAFVGLIVLVALQRAIPDGMWVVVPIAPTALATLATTRAARSAANTWRSSRMP